MYFSIKFKRKEVLEESEKQRHKVDVNIQWYRESSQLSSIVFRALWTNSSAGRVTVYVLCGRAG